MKEVILGKENIFFSNLGKTSSKKIIFFSYLTNFENKYILLSLIYSGVFKTTRWRTKTQNSEGQKKKRVLSTYYKSQHTISDRILARPKLTL